MSEPIKRYPLQWPPGWKRTPPGGRREAQFHTRASGQYGRIRRDLSVNDAIHRVLGELSKMAVYDDDVAISTNLELRLDGLPRSNQSAPSDPGAAVYWRNGESTRCMAVDHYTRVADNLAAIAATLDAMRAIERHGGAAILDRAFIGFEALPSPAQWWHVLGFETTEGLTLQEVEERYDKLAMQRHPDRGGSNDAMAELNWARGEARSFLGVEP